VRDWFRTRRELPAILYRAVGLVVRFLFWTYRVRVVDPRGFLEHGRPWPAVFALWHNRLIFLPLCFPMHVRRRTATLASISRDGEYAAGLISALGLPVLRGSTSRGGHRALRRLKQHLDGGGSVVLTVDGPRGPRYTVQSGAVVLAGLSGHPLVPVCLNAPRRWELNGWDRTQIPIPFSRVELVIGAPLTVARPRGREEVASEAERLRRALLRITHDGPTHPLPAGELRRVRKQWSAERPLLLQEGALCQRIKASDGIWLLRRPFRIGAARAALEAHQQCVERGDLLKDGPKRRLSRVRVGDARLVVKEFRKAPRWYGPWAPDRRTWLNLYRMETHALPAPRGHAWLRGPSGRGWIVMADAGRTELTETLVQTRDPRQRRELIEAAARLVAWSHLAGAYQPDFKIPNLVPTANPDAADMPLALVDVDAVRFTSNVASRLRRVNLAQILDSFPPAVTRLERARFLAVYRRETRMDRARFRKLIAAPRG